MSKSRSQSPSRDKEAQDIDNVLDAPWDAPPPYELHSSGSILASTSRVNDEGKVDIEFSSLQPDELNRLLPPDKAQEIEPSSSLSPAAPPSGSCPALNVVIQVVGSRGDVQPFIALGVALQRYGHRVRLATHDTFKDIVRSSGLEFYPVGGDPEDLMAYMVKNPGLIPSMESLRGGDIGRKRVMIHDMLRGFWSSCVKPDLVSNRPFVADAIIANPPSFAHVHCAQALGIPLHMMFTMPWTATRSFPHPLANIQSKNMDPRASNYLSYGVVDLMTWQGLGDVINAWRVKDLHLDPLAAAVGPDIVGLMKVPYTYCWSPALVPKPSDWGDSIDICGFFMRDEPSYTPPQDLADFLASGPPPVYIGFGSIVIADPTALTDIIKESCRVAGARVIISRGWSKLGGNDPSTDSIFYLGDCPHEWLFKRVAAVVHHGGAGTTACGLVNGRPTTIVPFFGDQPFWGSVVASNGAGPSPIAYKSISVEKLSSAIKFCLSPEAQAAANRIASQMRQESGVNTAVESFHRHLPVADLTCDLIPQNAAKWQYVARSKKGGKDHIRLSNAALKVLLDAKKVKLTDFEPLRPKEYLVENERWDPVTAGASSVLGTVTDFTSALGGAFIDPFKDVKRVRPDGTRRSAGTATAVASGKALQGMTTAVVKGSLVDVPLAFAEGFRNTPRLYGEKVADYGPVTDWKSGSTVAAKNFGIGFYEGLTDIVTKPMKGAKEEGTKGFFKGLGQGSLNMVAKPGSAMFGLLAYPAQGVYKSVQSMKTNKARDAVAAGRVESLSEGEVAPSHPDAAQVVRRFQELTG
ncbi:sterol glucosyltransferase [Fusarium tjaetaba]|uniref:Sterol glucosyltransferase n=1 Tax=Fusarium tjaetaba TaxID=1567544 RepID=A0A8H5S3D2_9HYPO|nr:sterol glucosyltransferase [Fusarium tjaetaba]KAF5643402.1 sterol glucosyltransferase [Fusarium tjaetaba]